MGRAARTKDRAAGGAGTPPSGRGPTAQKDSSSTKDYTLDVSISGPGRATLKVDDVQVTNDAAGSYQLPAGCQVKLSGAGRSGGVWQGWSGLASKGNTCLLYMSSDRSVQGTAVDKDKAPRKDDKSKILDSQWIDPLGNSRESEEDLAEGMAAELLRQGGIVEAEDLAAALRGGNFSADALAELQAKSGLDDSDMELLRALRPSVTSRIPDHLQNPSEALAWLRGDRSLIIDPETSVPGMTEAGVFLSEAIDDGKKIAVFVDYDVDGIASGEILREAFGVHGAEVEMGYADLENGFGLNEDFVRRAHEAGCEVLVTADCGSASEDAVRLAQSLGMKVVVSDHHETDGHEDNPADFHLNPDLSDSPAAGNTGSQIAWKLAAAMHEARGGIPDSHYGQSLWWAGFGARADGGSLIDSENRAFLHHDDLPEGVRELGDMIIARGSKDRMGSEMSDLDVTRMAINIGKRLDHIETVETETVMTKGNKKKGQPPLPQHRHAYDYDAREYRDIGPREKPVPGGAVLSREDFSPEDVARALSHPDPQTRREAQEKVVRALDYQARLEKEAEDYIAGEIRETWKADDGTLVRDPSLPTVPHVVLEDERMSGISRPIANSLQSHTRLPSLAFVPAGQDEEGNDLFKFSATPVRGQSIPLGKAMPEIADICTDLGGHDQVFGGVCRREDIPEVVSRVNSWVDKQGDVAPSQIRPSGGKVWVSEEKISSGEELQAVEEGRDRLAPFTENYDSYNHFGPTVSVVGTVSEFRAPPDGTDDSGQKVQAASKSRTHYAILELEDGTRREVKVSSRKDREALEEAQKKHGKLEIALGIDSRHQGAHSVRAVRPHAEVPF